ncbi:septal ring lytic transglycosylase RlpA family protein [Fluviibacter phosphoraccumulans]|uniref:septal ring lytic transglycosylase RlpA family protein n=1 Tax=Fluviibacter phosphoraccumulans TaxID=1751046 RepID=UPI0024E2692B|nr:septal ring lytic transglycosylase RlpA family protein [Fluviibacter phosphoraccumulans]
MKRYCPSLISLAVILLVVQLNGCSSTPSRSKPMASAPSSGGYVMKPYPRKGGGFYKDDGLPAQIPENIDQIPNATPRMEPLRNAANKPYTVLGMSFTPMTRLQPFSQQGIGSWYGTKFNGLKTSNGDTYDMFAMTAAHPTLPLPCYVRVTNTQNNRSVIVRVNDRGPFHNGRIIDLSFTAAYKLGYVDQGSSPVRVELIMPDASAVTYAELSKDALAANDAKIDDKTRYGEEVPKPGTYVQMGAFQNGFNAQVLRNHLLRELDWMTPAQVHVYAEPPWHRVQVGPFATRVQAETVQVKIRDALGGQPHIAVRQ